MNEYLNKSITVSIITLMLITPIQLIGQRSREASESTVTQAKADAEVDAKEDVNALQWIGCGCLIYGVPAAFLVVPSPKQERLIGKSADYVYVYTSAYKAKRRSLQTRYAMIGCATTTVIGIGVLIYAISSEGIECCTGPDASCTPDFSGCDTPDCSSSGCSSPSCSSPEGCSSSSNGCSGD